MNWPSNYFHAGLRSYLSVYVDDFKMSGPTQHLAKGWKLVGKRLRVGAPTDSEKHLGCLHSQEPRVIDATGHPFASPGGGGFFRGS